MNRDPLPTFQTTRLTLRPLDPEDGRDLFHFYRDPPSMRFMPSKPHTSVSQTIGEITQELARGARYWALLPTGSGPPEIPQSVVGYAGFLGGTRVPGMGYLLRRELWNRGLATEALRPLLGYGFDRLGYDRVELWINEANHASQKVAAKLGFRPKGRIHQRYSWEETHHIMLTFGIRASEWNPADQGSQTSRPQPIGLQPVLAVSDVEQTAAFYRDVLGFEVSFIFGDPPSHAGVALGDWSSESIFIQFTRGRPAPAGWLYIMVEAQIDGLFDRLVQNGAKVLGAPRTFPWGMREFSLLDPEGYELRFGTHAFSGEGE